MVSRVRIPSSLQKANFSNKVGFSFFRGAYWCVDFYQQFEIDCIYTFLSNEAVPQKEGELWGWE
tara:strand:- start:1298 stop:1489 length:192 start_codon:yes stop_codon:yes gene_type:complete